MVNLIIEHEWKEKHKDEAFKVVGSIIDMEKNKKLPEGFKLISVQVLANMDRAIAS